ncbi:molybdate ABC transporter substrate-binding protein, partial [Corallococcus exiguus]|uniref:molybdate ABC transporter substrate-binding protein n=2 Tax=Corallococcus exiguus TaxID=83462 RepID=UPI0020167D7C
AALAAVEAGRADAGVVYATDAAQSKKVRVVFTVPEGDAPRVVYPAAALTQGKAPEGGLAFVRFLQTEGARKEFRRLGFLDASAAKAAPDAGVLQNVPPGTRGGMPDAGKGHPAP